MTHVDPTRWYTVTELADSKLILGLSKNGIKRMITSGRNGVFLRARKTNNRGHWRVLGAHILEFLSKV